MKINSPRFEDLQSEAVLLLGFINPNNKTTNKLNTV